MKINTLVYSLVQGIKNIGRNKMFSIASAATMSACIFMFGLFYILVTNFTGMVKEAEESVAVTVFFDSGLTDEQINELTSMDDADGELSDEMLDSVVGGLSMRNLVKRGSMSRKTTSREKRSLPLLSRGTIRLPIPPTMRSIWTMWRCRHLLSNISRA